MERYRVQESIRDVIAILDSAPIHWDMMPDTNIVQIANRAPIAHLAIERGFKALISEKLVEYEWTHSLNNLYQYLQECDEQSAAYLSEAFNAAVGFFGFNVNRKGFKQLRSLYGYLSLVGTDNAFEALRYWAIGESAKGPSPIPYIALPIHRELLCALWCLFLPSRRETVSERVEHEVTEALFSRRHIAYSPDDVRRKQSVYWYISWLHAHASPRGALEEAYRKGFVISDDEFITQTLRDAYQELQESKDPAVRYYVSTLTYLPKGSERRNRDATPEVQWIGEGQLRGTVVTPPGTILGFIDRYADGSWGITPMEEGLVRVTDIAWAQADAKHYLVNRLTRLVTVTVNGESKQLRLVGPNDSFPRVTRTSGEEGTSGLILHSEAYELEFWNNRHSLCVGDNVRVELELEPDRVFVSVVEGIVASLAAQTVSIAGSEFLDVKRGR